MNETKHTPGPLVLSREFEAWLHQETITILPERGAARNQALAIVLQPTTDGRMVANARLFAAAPDLLVALEQALEAVIWSSGSNEVGNAPYWRTIRDEQMPTWYAAIAKARGEVVNA